MAFKVPTLQECVDATYRAFKANLPGSDAYLWPNNVAVSAKVIGAGLWLPFAFLDYISKQILVTTAEGIWLDRHGADWGITRGIPTYAEGYVDFTGTTGIAIPAGGTVQRSDGVKYTILTGGTVDGSGDASIYVRAEAAGKTGNAIAGTPISLSAPIAGITTEGAAASSGIGSGADVETDAAYRSRILHRKQFRPAAGAPHDYVAWVREIAGVTRVYVDRVTATNGRTTVGVWFLMDDVYTNGIPQTADVAAVTDHLEIVSPVGASIAVAAPVPVSVDIEIANLSPDTAEVRDQINLELADMFRRDVKVSTVNEPYSLPRSKIWEAVSIASGEDSHEIADPLTDVTLSAGEIAVLGTVTFT